jgi:hypothetical protein
LKHLLITVLCCLALAAPVFADTDPEPAETVAASSSLTAWVQPTVVLDNYFAAFQKSQTSLRNTTMEVEIEAQLPMLKKSAILHALRGITRLGHITYEAVWSSGDKTALKDVIARYMSAETEASSGKASANGKPLSIGITPENYKFKYKGTSTVGDRRTYIFQVTPKKKREGLFKGELLVDAETFLPVMESGEFVKNPSVFLRKVKFVRRYEIQDGVAVPTAVETVVDTRIVGQARLNIRFANLTLPEIAQSRFCPLGW